MTAVPRIEDNKIRLKELPNVSPYPFSKGSANILAYDLSSLNLMSSLEGLINAFQFLLFISKFSIYTLLFFGGLLPLCGIGVVSLIEIILKPLACNALKAVSRPDPGPLTSTDKVFIPCSRALDAAESAATCAAYGVDFLEPLKPFCPAEAHDTTLPLVSAIEIIVLLIVD